MKLPVVLVAMASLVLLPMIDFNPAVFGGAAVAAAEPYGADLNSPPVAQPLVREGDFAAKLVEALDLGTPVSGSAAESTLSAAGIAPSNGWIADYPMTPEVLGQLQSSIRAAAGSGRLMMGTDEALAALQTVSDDFGLNVVVSGPGGSAAAGEPAPGSGVYAGPETLDGYYSTYGPPVITYYSPPPDYLYLYSWVPSSFWCTGFYFPGFFILNDFDTVVVFHHRRKVITNHVFDHRAKRHFLVNPVNGRRYRSVREFPQFNRLAARRGAERIYRHSWQERSNPGAGALTRGFDRRGSQMPSRSSGLYSRGRAIRPTDRSPREHRLFNGPAQTEVAGPRSGSAWHPRPHFSGESPIRPGGLENPRSFGAFHGAGIARIPGSGMRSSGFNRGFHGGRFEGAPEAGMRRGSGSGIQGSHMAHGFAGGFHRSGMGQAGFGNGFRGGGFRR